MTAETSWISRVRQWAAGSAAAVKLGAAVVAALALLVLLGELAAWRRVREVEQRVVQVAPTRRFADLERVRVPAELAVPVVPGRVLERLARDYDRPGLATVTPAGEVVDARGAVLPGGLAGAEVALDYALGAFGYGAGLYRRAARSSARLRPLALM